MIKNILLGLLSVVAIALILSGGDREEQVLKATAPSVVRITSAQGGGTGFVVKAPSGKSVVVTNDHICDLGEVKADSRLLIEPFTLTKLTSDDNKDLCVMSAPANLSPLEVASEPAHIYQKVYLVGHPHLNQVTITSGRVRERVVVKLDTEIEAKQCKGANLSLEKVLIFGIFEAVVCQRAFKAVDMTAEALPGNSGSPVVDSLGKVLGVLFAGSEGASAYIDHDNLTSILSNY